MLSAKEHVSEVERLIHIIKERARALRSRMPYKALPRPLVVGIVKHVGKWLNDFIPKNYISQSLSPRTLLAGERLDYNNHCRVEVGSYVQTHDEPQQLNNVNVARTIGAIALEHSGNIQGGYYFLSLTSGRIIKRRRWTETPITTDVINRVEALATNKTLALEFTNCHNDPLSTGVDEDSDDKNNQDDEDVITIEDDTVGSNDINESIDNSQENNEDDYDDIVTTFKNAERIIVDEAVHEKKIRNDGDTNNDLEEDDLNKEESKVNNEDQELGIGQLQEELRKTEEELKSIVSRQNPEREARGNKLKNDYVPNFDGKKY